MRTNWSLRIQNFGRISEAEIQISPMILFVGDNSSGKSYLMSLLWGMMEENYYDYLNIEECQNWEVYQNARAVFVNTVLQKEKNGALTNDEKRIFVQFFNVFFMENKEEILSSIFNGNIEGEFFEIKLLDKNQFNLDQQKIKLWRQELDKTVEHRKEKLFLRGVMNCCLQILFSDLIGDVDKPKGALFLPASRTGFMLTYKTLINESLKQHFGHKKMQGSIFTKPVIQFLNQIVAMGDEADNEYDDIIRYIEEEVIRGKVVTDHAPIKNIYFTSEGMQEQIPLYLTSSLVTELSSILLFLRDKKTPFKTLIIEEPEEHLHLKAQSMMAKILAMILNKNKNVWITTNSDTFFQQMNNLVKVYSHPRKTEVSKKFRLKEEELLNHKDIQVYQFDIVGDKTVVSNVPGSETGFPAITFNDVIDELINQVIELEEDDD